MDVAIRKGVADGLGDFSEYMLRALVGNGVDGVEAQTVCIELFDPIKRIV